MHPIISDFLKGLETNLLFRPYTMMELRELFVDDKLFEHAETCLQKSKAIKAPPVLDEEAAIKARSLAMAATYVKNLAQQYQKHQLSNTVNQFSKELNGKSEINFARRYLQDKEYGTHAKNILLAILNLHAIILQNGQKLDEAKAVYEEALKVATPNSIELAIILSNAALHPHYTAQKARMLTEALTIVKKLSEDHTPQQEHAHVFASIYCRNALVTTDKQEKLTFFERAYQLWPQAFMICNNYGIYLSDGDSDLNEFDLNSTTIEDLIKAREILQNACNMDTTQRRIVAPTYCAIALFKLAAKSRQQTDYDACKNMLDKCKEILDADDQADKKEYDDAYKADKRKRLSEIDIALMKLGLDPKPIVAQRLDTHKEMKNAAAANLAIEPIHNKKKKEKEKSAALH